MAGETDACIQEIINDIAALSAVKSAPKYPPEKIGTVMPFVTVYAGDGVYESGPVGHKKFLGAIMIDLHVARGRKLPLSFQSFMPLYDAIPNALFKGLFTDRFNNTMQTFEDVLMSKPTGMTYAGKNTIGIRFTMTNVKIISEVS